MHLLELARAIQVDRERELERRWPFRRRSARTPGAGWRRGLEDDEAVTSSTIRRSPQRIPGTAGSGGASAPAATTT